MIRIELTQGKTAIIDDNDFDLVSKYKWYFNKGYAASSSMFSKKIYMHRVVANPPVGFQVDHINGNKLDNRKENLRCCTVKQNTQNVRKHKDNTSGYKGVILHKPNNKYTVRIMENGKFAFFGYYSDPIEAAKVYDREAKRIFGEFASLNFEEK